MVFVGVQPTFRQVPPIRCLYDDDALARAGEPGRQRRPRLSGADDDRVEIFESFVHSRLRLLHKRAALRR
jgi:hypothetical protein